MNRFVQVSFFIIHALILVKAQSNDYCSKPSLFISSQFSGVPKSYSNVIYDSVIDYSGKKVAVAMNIYLPQPLSTPNIAAIRPLMVWIHGGSFVGGSKEDMNLFAQNSATVGYVSAAIGYRLGIPNLNPVTCNNVWSEFFKAGYRAVQDVKNGINFLKKNAASYGIDTNYIFIAGYSAGAITALNCAFMDEEDLKPMKSVIEGLGPLSKISNIKGVLSISGTLFDDCYIDEADKTPIFIAHGTCDDVVPYDTNPILFCPGYPKVSGGLGIAKRAACTETPYRMFTIEGMKHNILIPLYAPVMIADSATRYFKRTVLCGKPEGSSCIKNVANTTTCPKSASTCPGVCQNNPMTNTCSIVAIEEAEIDLFAAKVFPNPGSDILNVQCSVLSDICIYDIYGRCVKIQECAGLQQSIDISALTAGSYLISIRSKKLQQERHFLYRKQ